MSVKYYISRGKFKEFLMFYSNDLSLLLKQIYEPPIFLTIIKNAWIENAWLKRFSI